ncbi:MAG: DegV family protein [Erysipelotrichaceae bacterium]|nr:DegV family protein [Erysipelotrichaceae bacterium]
MIRLLVDSASDIPNTNSDNFLVVPLSIHLCNNDYIDGVTLNHDQFYEMLVSSSDFPKTSQPSPQAFVKAIEKVKAANDECICITLSSGVSGTYQSACLAKAIVDYDKIHVIDSLTGSYGVKLLVIEAQRMIKEGKTAEEIVEKLEDLKKRTTILLSVDTLEYLYKGGRLDKTSAIIGGIAKIKPIITVTREGKISVVTKAIGMNRVMNTIADLVEQIQPDINYPVYSIYTLGTKNVEKLENKLTENGHIIEERELLGPVVGSHVGPETFGVIFIAKNVDKIPI